MQAATRRQKGTLGGRSPEARSGFSVGRCVDHALLLALAVGTRF